MSCLPLAVLRCCFLSLIYLLSATVLSAAPFTTINDPAANTGAERCLSSGAGAGGNCASQGAYSGFQSMVQLFANAMGATLTRISDDQDSVWTAGAGAGIVGIGRSAGRDFSLGVLPGVSGGAFDERLSAIGSTSLTQVFYLPQIPAGQNTNNDLLVSNTLYQANLPVFSNLPSTYTNGTPFRFAILQRSGAIVNNTPDLWSSLPTNNTSDNFFDHMVTFQLNNAYLSNNNLTWYIAGFENARFAGGGDGDFNDYVFVFQNVVPVGASIPEPISTSLAGLGLVSILWLRRGLTREKGC